MSNDRTAFTLGSTESYDDLLTTSEDDVVKTGRYPVKSDGYEGGWVWATFDEANQFLDSDDFANAFGDRKAEFSVYELELATGWDTDASPPHHMDGVCRLLYDARVMGKIVHVNQ